MLAGPANNVLNQRRNSRHLEFVLERANDVAGRREFFLPQGRDEMESKSIVALSA
jgi:hypothetical protein